MNITIFPIVFAKVLAIGKTNNFENFGRLTLLRALYVLKPQAPKKNIETKTMY